MDELKRLHRGEMALKAYAEAGGVARRLMKTNPRLGQDKADWLAAHWAAARRAGGQWEILGDAAHKITNAQLYRVDEVLALYARITRADAGRRGLGRRLGGWWKGKLHAGRVPRTPARPCPTPDDRP